MLNLILFLLFQLPFNYFSRLRASVSVTPLVISLISILSVLPSLLVKALSRSLSAPNTCNCPQKITFLLNPSPLTSSYCLSSSYLPCSNSSSLALPLNFLWNTSLKISLIFKWANLTAKPAVSRRREWQQRARFHISDKEGNAFPFMISRFLTDDMCHAKFYPLGKTALSTRLDDTNLLSEVFFKRNFFHDKKNQTWETRKGRELQFLAMRTGFQMGCTVSSLSLDWIKPFVTWSDLRVDLALSRCSW